MPVGPRVGARRGSGEEMRTLLLIRHVILWNWLICIGTTNGLRDAYNSAKGTRQTTVTDRRIGRKDGLVLLFSLYHKRQKGVLDLISIRFQDGTGTMIQGIQGVCEDRETYFGREEVINGCTSSLCCTARTCQHLYGRMRGYVVP